MPADKNTENNLIIYKGSNFFKQRLILSTLSGKPVKITEIRSNESEPGVKDFEISLVKLLDKVTNGTIIDLNSTGTTLYYQPGLLFGGKIQHECSTLRGIGYYLDALIALGPFCKSPLNVTLRGVTNSKESPSVDHVKASGMEVLKKFIVVDDGLELQVVRRGLMPGGGGEIVFKCPVRKNLRPLQSLNPGMVKRIRGIAYASKVSPALSNRTMESCKSILTKFIPDVYIQTDQNTGKQAGNSAGFGINLVAETTEGIFYSTEMVSNIPGQDEGLSVPEELGKDAALKLLEEIYRGGCVESTYQWLNCLFMALGPKDVSKYLTGPLSEYTIHFLQHIRDFFSITFKLENSTANFIDNDEDDIAGSNKVIMTCVGIGYTNINKRTI